MTLDVVGQKVERRGLREKLTGEARYSADLKLQGMLYGAVLRSPHPHANVLSIDTSAADRLPGVHALVTPFDVPAGRIDGDLPILDTRVRYEGDEVAAVAADTPECAAEALRLLKVEYEVLPFVLDADAAMQPGAPGIHPGGNLVGGQPISLERGSVEQGFAQADLVLEEEYLVPAHGPAALEPRAVLANWQDGKLTVWKSTRGVHPDRSALARALQIPESDITVIGPYLGAGFGSKDESRTASLAAVLSQRAGRPVRIEYGRREEFVSGRTRHGARIRTKVGVKSDGTITAVHTTAYVDCGAYAASGPGVTRRLGQGSLYLYRMSQCPLRRPPGVHKPPRGRLLPCAGRSPGPLRPGKHHGPGRRDPGHGPPGVSPEEPRASRRTAGHPHHPRRCHRGHPARRGWHPLLQQRPGAVPPGGSIGLRLGRTEAGPARPHTQDRAGHGNAHLPGRAGEPLFG